MIRSQTSGRRVSSELFWNMCRIKQVSCITTGWIKEYKWREASPVGPVRCPRHRVPLCPSLLLSEEARPHLRLPRLIYCLKTNKPFNSHWNHFLFWGWKHQSVINWPINHIVSEALQSSQQTIQTSIIWKFHDSFSLNQSLNSRRR